MRYRLRRWRFGWAVCRDLFCEGVSSCVVGAKVTYRFMYDPIRRPPIAFPATAGKRCAPAKVLDARVAI